jgi:hypothetical protein
VDADAPAARIDKGEIDKGPADIYAPASDRRVAQWRAATD